MYVCPKIYIRRALSKKSVAPWSQTNRNVFSARLNRSVDKSAECREDGKLFQIYSIYTDGAEDFYYKVSGDRKVIVRVQQLWRYAV